MTRGDVVSIADRGGDFTGRPRPAVIVQSDLFATLNSVTVCPLTSTDADSPVLRLRVDPTAELRLDRTSWIAIDKITTVRRDRIGRPIGRLSQADMRRLNGAVAVFLGIGD
jgi:mRNA interferase MazF